MKNWTAVALVLVIAATMLSAACTTEVTTTIRSTSTVTATTTLTTTPKPTETTLPPVVPPTEDELRALGFLGPEIPRITATDLQQMIDNGEGFILVDLRPANVYNNLRIPGAINIPIEPEDLATTQLLALPRNKLIILY